MNEQRAFTIVVTECSNCPYAEAKRCVAFSNHQVGIEVFDENKEAITPTCPMWNEAKPIGELK